MIWPLKRRPSTHGLGATWAFAVLISLLVVMTSCGQSSSDSSGSHANASGPATISLSYLSQGSAGMGSLIPSFEAKYPKIKVNSQGISPDTYSQAVFTQIQAGNAADVLYTNGGTGQDISILKLGKDGYLKDLSGTSWAGKTVPKAAHSLYWSGKKLYGIPMALSTVGVLYNVSAFNQLGLQVPTTFNQLTNLCRTIKGDGKIPMMLAGQVPDLYALSLAAGTVYADTPNWNTERADRKVTFAGSAGWKRALTEFSDLSSAGCFQPGAASGTTSQAFSAMASGQALMFLAPSAALGAIQSLAPSLDVEMFPTPGPTAAATRAVVEYNDAFSVNAQSSHSAAAETLVQFLSEPSQQDTYAKINGEISLPDAATGNLPAPYKPLAADLKSGKEVSLPSLTWPNAGVANALTQGLQGLVTGQSNTSEILQNMDSAWESGS